jgi:Fe-S oxidoreductase
MCPSYRATGDEQHSTRGRARLLFEYASGRAGVDAAHADDVAGALDLCLSCKGCKKDCPVGVDMAAYKAEFLAQRYAGRRRPVTHYSLGWLPRWLRLVARTRSAAALNRAARIRPLAALAKRLGGVAPERDIPPLATESFQAWFARRGPRGPVDGARLLVWPDTFTNYLEPAIGRDAVAALEALGYRVEVPSAPVCCGLTWHSTGQLDHAKKVLARTLAVLGPWLDAGVPIVGLEPSCTATLKTDATELLPDDPRAARLSASVRSLAEILREHTDELRTRAAAAATAGADGAGINEAGESGAVARALVQVHCHQHADLGFEADRAVMAALGVEADVLDSGCCGLAGNFGFEQGHYEVSQACAERVLYPALRADQQARVVADGYSCRTQIRQGAGRDPVHLAHLAAAVLTPAPAPADTPA